MLTATQIEMLKTGIKIETNADLTPKGKRSARVVRHAISGKKIPARFRWYVGGKAYMDKPLTQESIDLTKEWLAA